MRMSSAITIMMLLLASGGPVFAVSEPSDDVQVDSPAGDEPALPTERVSPTKAPVPEWFSRVTVENGRLTILVENRPLEWVLEEISRLSGVAVTGAEGVTDGPVSMQVNDIPLDQGLRQLLKDRDVFFFYGSEEKGGDEQGGDEQGGRNVAPSGSSLKAVWVYPKGQGRRMAPIPPEQWASSREFEQGLTHTDSAERVRSIQVLVERKGDQAVDEIQRALRDPDDQVRERALQAALDSSVPLPPLVLEGLVQSDPSPTVRFLALGAIVSGSAESFADDPRIRTVAELALNDPSPDVKEQAKQILEQLDYSAQPPEPEPPQGEEDAQ